MIKNIVLKIINFYKLFISPILGQRCRFYPSCSKYSYQSITNYGLMRGGYRTLKRILKCGPWHRGGVDLP